MILDAVEAGNKWLSGCESCLPDHISYNSGLHRCTATRNFCPQRRNTSMQRRTPCVAGALPSIQVAVCWSLATVTLIANPYRFISLLDSHLSRLTGRASKARYFQKARAANIAAYVVRGAVGCNKYEVVETTYKPIGDFNSSSFTESQRKQKIGQIP